MKEDPTIVDTLFERVKEFGISYIELLKLRAIDFASEVVSSIIPDILFICFVLVVLLFLNLGLAFWLGDITGRLYIGFLMVSGFYLLLGLVLKLFMRSWFKKQVENYFVRHIFRQTNS